jgi:hypothetical protein
VTNFCCYNGATTAFGPPTSITFTSTTTEIGPFFNSFIALALPGELGEAMANHYIAAGQNLQLITSNQGGGSTSPIVSNFASSVQTNLCNFEGFCNATDLLTPSYLSLSDPPNEIFSANLTNSPTPPAGAVPEPSSFLLFGTGLIGAIGTLRRRVRR